MTDFISPLQLETWIVSVFAGTPEIFGAVALLVITGLAAYFRFTGVGLFFMLGMFLLMFIGFTNSVLLTLIAIIGGLLIGFWIAKIFTQ